MQQATLDRSILDCTLPARFLSSERGRLSWREPNEPAEGTLNRHRTFVVAGLGTTQTLAWASSFYLPAILGVPIAVALGVAPTLIFGLFSGALLLSAATAPYIGNYTVDCS